MSVVARLKVTEISLMEWATRVKMQAVVAQDDPHSEEIKAFHAATPSATFEATINNSLAAEQFQPGKHFYLSLDPVPSE